MSISSVSFGCSAHPTATSIKNALQQRSSDFSALSQALGSNNLTGAQSAFATLKQDSQQIPVTQTSAQTPQQASALQKVRSDAQTLATALGTNILGAAKTAFAAVKQDSAHAPFGRHHFHYSPIPAVANSSSAVNTILAGTSSDYRAAAALSSVGGTLNLTA
jgi:hypothetical protein